ncbi:hypothetical protein PSECIP111854_00985 [Pseudoalteromonas sp. CIP111854]|uniref:HTH LytTR-type domain-containing protein n=1 Tax=Pseudoalteromonas holothuriae TaxID=2963714 RepID=A0A9W4QTJ7_9GAMM|nr:LytTR family DNA-binding domain-containing protein [Pseudoalteromonas sp. CIP111854]CAH9052517.1 hypothetical protein PSECIP111854_00985 [Pseudoalteromonas sp. CIP111854]
MIKFTPMYWALFMVFCGFSSFCKAQNTLIFLPYDHFATVCQFKTVYNSPPTFDSPYCKQQALREINPQLKNIWIKIEFDLPNRGKELKALNGFYISGKAASAVYLNKHFLGLNGFPGVANSHTQVSDAPTLQEKAGKMDSVFFIPYHLLRPSKNELVIHLSGHHSLITLDNPMHIFALGQYGSPKRFIQHYSEFGLILIGAFLVGVLYFLALSLGNQAVGTYRIFAALCFLATLQLGAELSRKLIDYTYQWHDIRLIAITTLSFMFGILILVYSSNKLAGKHAVHWIYSGIIVTSITLIFAPGFDNKTTMGIFNPLLFSLLQLFYYWIKNKDPNILRWLVVQLFVAITIVIDVSSFHEIAHFAIIGILVCYLFIQQASEVKNKQLQLYKEQTKLAKLEYKLEQNIQGKTPSKLEISVAGKTDYLSTSSIAYCKAARDYVELHLIDKSEKLYSGSLKQLEETLPKTFLRVHRSYLVNLDEVVSLSSNQLQEENNNELTLSNHQKVPVSRRLLPAVKNTLKHSI